MDGAQTLGADIVTVEAPGVASRSDNALAAAVSVAEESTGNVDLADVPNVDKDERRIATKSHWRPSPVSTVAEAQHERQSLVVAWRRRQEKDPKTRQASLTHIKHELEILSANSADAKVAEEKQRDYAEFIDIVCWILQHTKEFHPDNHTFVLGSEDMIQWLRGYKPAEPLGLNLQPLEQIPETEPDLRPIDSLLLQLVEPWAKWDLSDARQIEREVLNAHETCLHWFAFHWGKQLMFWHETVVATGLLTSKDILQQQRDRMAEANHSNVIEKLDRCVLRRMPMPCSLYTAAD